MSGPLEFPLRIDPTGRTASADPDGHARDLVELVLTTDPHERPMRPDFGCGLKSLVFAPMDDVLATATRSLIEAQLRRWLDDVIAVEGVTVEAGTDAALRVTVQYRRRIDGAPGTAEVTVA